MLDISRDIHSLTDFKKNTSAFIDQLKQTGEPVVLTINGKAELVVQDAAAYQKLREMAEESRVLEGIGKGIEDMKAGRMLSLDEFKQHARSEARNQGVKYRLRVTARAVGDADEAHAWIAQNRSLDQADRWYQGLFDQMETLTLRPARCPRAAESDKFPMELRALLYGKGKNVYRIIFTIQDQDVVVLFVHHCSRKQLEP